eukprot:CAMPEP_0184008730 /NCGR_PEP_ID=MMETSP0954-20121128/2156_1 /TAXON_ID=627963 /ORGANISM="Aplanochytrium sp, Strain PBS07" /LENGTH=1028 /DNA_ID=CAMNT_0026287913 /DNA_START=29 /DNA_END=3112 /DNA_ORIENTATION=+
MAKSVSVGLIFVTTLVGAVLGLHEDQAGVNDWYKQHTGVPDIVAFSNDHAYMLSSETQALSAVDTESGEVKWRRFIGSSIPNSSFSKVNFQSVQVLGKGRSNSLTKAIASVAVVYTQEISAGAEVQTVAAWDGDDGTPVWETDVELKGTFQQSLFFSIPGGSKTKSKANRAVALLNQDSLSIFSATTGKSFWSWEPKKTDNMQEVVWSNMWLSYKDSETLLNVIGKDTNNVFVAKVSVSKAKVESVLRIESVGKPESNLLHVAPTESGHFVGFLNSENGFVLYNVDTTEVFTLNLPNDVLSWVKKSSEFEVKSSDELGGPFVLFDFTGAKSCKEKKCPAFALRVDMKLQQLVVISDNFELAASPSRTLANAKSNKKSTVARLVGVTSSGVLENDLGKKFGVSDAAARGSLSGLFIMKSKAEECALLTFRDGSLMFASLDSKQGQARIKWIREEALSDVAGNPVAVQMPRLNTNDTSASELLDLFNKGNSISLFVARLRSQVATVTASVSGLIGNVANLIKLVIDTNGEWLVKAYNGELGGTGYSDFDKSNFGFTNVVVLVTRRGKVFGMESESGNILWSIFEPEYANAKVKLFLTRKRTSGVLPPEVAIVTENGGCAFHNALTGEIILKEKLDEGQKIKETFTVSFDSDGDEKTVILALTSGLEVQIFPRSSKSAFLSATVNDEALTEQIRVFSVEKEKGSIFGFAISEESNSILKARKVWSMTIPTKYKIEAVGTHPNDEMSSPARKIGGGAVMMKHVNPHLVAVAAVSEELSSTIVSLIDVITGKVVERFFHKHCVGPVKFVMYENNIVYVATNSKLQRADVFAVSMYEGDVIEKFEMNPIYGIPETVNSETTTSSFELKGEKLLVPQRGFFIPYFVKALAVTSSRHGITERAVLAALETGAVVSIDRRLLDPRRPIGTPSSQEMEEGLIGYFGEIPLSPVKMITHVNDVHNVRTIMSIPTNLESTSLVLVVGMDMFYTRLQPSLGFDLLAEEFNYPLLILLTIGLSVGTFMMSKALKKKELSKKW